MRDYLAPSIRAVSRSIRDPVVALVAFAVACVPAFAQVGYTVRATESDYIQLAHDVARLGIAEREFDRRKNDPGLIKTMEMNQLYQLLGSDENGIFHERGVELRQWWLDHVRNPALDVAENPAASCAFALHVLKRYIEIEKQSEVFGIEGERLASGDDVTLDRAFLAAKQRCLVEAYDECMATGDGQPLVDAAVEWDRFSQLMGLLDEPDWYERIAYLFRRCTVYRFGYHLELEELGEEPYSLVADGTFTMLFDFGEAGGGLVGLQEGIWRAPRPQELLSPDMWLSNMNCGPNTVSCEREGPPLGGGASGRIELKRYVRQQTIRIDRSKPEDSIFGGRLVVDTETIPKGEDKLKLNFGLPIQGISGRYREGFGDIRTFPGQGTDIYYFATGSTFSNPAEVTDWGRHGYPVLFTAMPSASDGTHRIRRAEYQVVHRPDLFPPEEIDARFEIVSTEVPEPPRVPLRPPQ